MNRTESNVSETTSSSRDKISSEPIPCTVENCTKTFRKQSLLDYHLKYHHYITSDSAASVAQTASPNSSMISGETSSAQPKKQQQQQKQERRLSASINDKTMTTTAMRKRSFLKLTSLSSSLNLNNKISSTMDENADVVDVEENADDVFIGELVGLSDSASDNGRVDPYEVIHCKCGSHSSVGFMIQVESLKS